MDVLRKIILWISKHPKSTIAGVGVLILLILGINLILSRTQGSLTEPIKRGLIVDAVYGIGTVTATHTYAIKPGTIANISELYIKEGDPVQKGAALAKLDSIIYRAPFEGVVTFLPYQVGENIFAQFPALVLTDMNHRYIVVTLEQQGALRLKPGQRAKLSFDSIRSQTYDGTVKSVYSYNNSFLARIDIDRLPLEILPDMTADIAIIVNEIPDALVIPISAFDNGKVWVKRGHALAKQTPITLGVVDGAMGQLLTGDVKEGDRLLIRKKATP